MKHLILLVPIILLLTPSRSAASNAAVLDVDGHKVRPGVKYYVLPVFRGLGGGLAFSKHGDLPCPLYVGQESSEVNDGFPVTFSPVDPDDKIVRLSTDLNVQFPDVITICIQSMVWELGSADEVTGRRYVLTSGQKGNPGAYTVNNWFKIERYKERDYKLVFCPSVCESCKVVCGDVGVFVEDEERWLGLDGMDFPVMFKRSN
ncbi:kunitz trypsin inhibitor 5-like [Typha angustifolia]|uniref:kunitz trypsin inhibitor 5-like n=1 Tax=Typha angustifolia TaxID=59011 RepID=UPI003C2D4F5D